MAMLFASIYDKPKKNIPKSPSEVSGNGSRDKHAQSHTVPDHITTQSNIHFDCGPRQSRQLLTRQCLRRDSVVTSTRKLHRSGSGPMIDACERYNLSMSSKKEYPVIRILYALRLVTCHRRIERLKRDQRPNCFKRCSENSTLTPPKHGPSLGGLTTSNTLLTLGHLAEPFLVVGNAQ